jgi:hypothetical protein
MAAARHQSKKKPTPITIQKNRTADTLERHGVHLRIAKYAEMFIIKRRKVNIGRSCTKAAK